MPRLDGDREVIFPSHIFVGLRRNSLFSVPAFLLSGYLLR